MEVANFPPMQPQWIICFPMVFRPPWCDLFPRRVAAAKKHKPHCGTCLSRDPNMLKHPASFMYITLANFYIFMHDMFTCGFLKTIFDASSQNKSLLSAIASHEAILQLNFTQVADCQVSLINVDAFQYEVSLLVLIKYIIYLSSIFFWFNIWNHERSSYIFSCFVAAKVDPHQLRAPPSRVHRYVIEVLSSFDSIGNFQFGVLKNGENPKINQWGKTTELEVSVFSGSCRKPDHLPFPPFSGSNLLFIFVNSPL